MTYQWVYCDRASVARRYDKLANYIKLCEWLLCVPKSLRRKAAEALHVNEGDRVLEIGCGTGLNLPFLREVVGAQGHVYGVDISEGMLEKAGDLRARSRWNNVTLVNSDALAFHAPEPLDAVLFGLSYNTMPHHRAVLAHALTQLRPGGRVVIMDAKAPDGALGQMVLPFGAWLMKHTLLGNPYIRPWEHMAEAADDVETQDFLFGSYYICGGVKPETVAPWVEMPQLVAAE